MSSAEIKGRDFEAALDYFRREHRAIVIAVMPGDKALVNPEVGLRLEAGDDLAVIAVDEPRIYGNVIGIKKPARGPAF